MIAVLTAVIAGAVSGCATAPISLDPRRDADGLMEARGFKKEFVRTEDFLLCTYVKVSAPGMPLTVYVEGDGMAWKSRNRLSDDPTPLRQVALKLAAIDPSPNVAYLARPGQFLPQRELERVSPDHWSEKRFADEVIRSADEAVGRLAGKAQARQVHLVGYSGGAAVAVLTAARRGDVASLRTVAGNLDPDEVNRLHRVSPLRGSLIPIDAAERLSGIPQVHFVGAADKVVAPVIAERFRAASGVQARVRIRIIEGASHDKGWSERWLELLADAPE